MYEKKKKKLTNKQIKKYLTNKHLKLDSFGKAYQKFFDIFLY